MRLYVSGPMRGLPNNNFDAFHAASKQLRLWGHDVLSPADSFKDENGNTIKLPRSEYLKHDIQLILICDGVVVIDGWYDSPGARFEVAQAFSIDIPVFEIFQKTKYEKALREIDVTSVTIPRERQYMRKVPLLGVTGYARAGKDTFAEALIQNEGWKRVAFADPLKAIARDIGWNGEKDDYGRVLLQNLGVAVREHLRSEAWVTVGEDAIEHADAPVVVTDVRFLNEINMIHRRGGKIIRVDRPGVEAANAHVSEHEWQKVPPDAVFHNDGTLDEIPEKARKFVAELFA